MNTVFLATVMGWYMVIISLFMLLRQQQARELIADVLSQRGLFFIVAIITLIIGLLLVASHNVWVMGWPVLVTLIGWLVLLSGLLRLVCASTAVSMGQSMVERPARMQVTAIILLIIGLYLLFHVYYPALAHPGWWQV